MYATAMKTKHGGNQRVVDNRYEVQQTRSLPAYENFINRPGGTVQRMMPTTQNQGPGRNRPGSQI